MLFNGGIVASYFIYSNVIHIKDTIFALIVPNLMMNAFNIILVKNYFSTNVVGELLEGAGYAVTLAADCAQARRAWTESQPDAALLDVMLPDGDGFSLLEELRRAGAVPLRTGRG